MSTDQPGPQRDPSLLDHAIAAAGNGWFVFPCKPGTKDPAVKWGTAATNDPEQVRRWWTENPRYNIGIACGPSGLVVIDLDVGEGKDGVQRWEELTDEHGTPPTYTVGTPSGGRHHYFTLPDDWEPVGNSASKLAPGSRLLERFGYLHGTLGPNPFSEHNAVLVVVAQFEPIHDVH